MLHIAVLLLAAIGSLADVVYLVGDYFPTGRVGYASPLLAQSPCPSNASWAMAQYLSVATSDLVRVQVSQCGSYTLSDMLNGLSWIQSDAASATSRVTVGIAVAVPQDGLVDGVLSWMLARRAVVVVQPGQQGPLGVLEAPSARHTAPPALPAPATLAPPPRPAPVIAMPPRPAPAYAVPAGPPYGRSQCDTYMIAVGASCVVLLILVCVCAGAFVLWTRRARQDARLEQDLAAHLDPRRGLPRSRSVEPGSDPHSGGSSRTVLPATRAYHSYGPMRPAAPFVGRRGSAPITVDSSADGDHECGHDIMTLLQHLRASRLGGDQPIDEDRSVHRNSLSGNPVTCSPFTAASRQPFSTTQELELP